MVMEGGDENMEANITTQQDDEFIGIENNQFMEEQNVLDFEQVFNQGPLHVQETSPLIKQTNNHY